MWSDKIISSMAELGDTHIINDSKTPSGRVHVGSLRGVLVHDIVNRMANKSGLNSKFIYGVDDLDPLDGYPEKDKEKLLPYMGIPLCSVPSPDKSFDSMADFYIDEFLGIFKTLGVDAEIYRLQNIYKDGKFNDAIDRILHKVDKIRNVYADFSKHKKDLSSWYPFQAICEKCGKIATTRTFKFDGKEIEYKCEENQVSWSKGCGYVGKTSPFDGGGKMPWKIEWIAKWHSFNITVEGAGKDHCTKGGSRDVANRCYTDVFGKKPPLNIPYEFFLMGGSKMSSSKGVGFYAKDMSDFLPSEILRFLMARQQPKKTVNFSVDSDYIIKLFNEYDRVLAGVENDIQDVNYAELSDADKVFFATKISDVQIKELVSFQTIMTLMKMPHIDAKEKIFEQLSDNISDEYRASIIRRIESAKYWMDKFSTKDDMLEFQSFLPNRAGDMSIKQKSFICELAKLLDCTDINLIKGDKAEYFQNIMFDAARLVPITTKEAFEAFYICVFDKTIGPKGGSIILYLGKDKIVSLLKNMTLTLDEVLSSSDLCTNTAIENIGAIKNGVKNIEWNIITTETNKKFLQLLITSKDLKTHKRNIAFTEDKNASECFASEWLNKISGDLLCSLSKGI